MNPPGMKLLSKVRVQPLETTPMGHQVLYRCSKRSREKMS